MRKAFPFLPNQKPQAKEWEKGRYTNKLLSLFNIIYKIYFISKELNDIMKLDLLSSKTPSEIGDIWTSHFVHKDSVSAVIPSETYFLMKKRLEIYQTVRRLLKSHGTS